MLKGNKGEWSEIYVFLKLLSDGKLHAADADLKTLQDVYYPLVSIIRKEADTHLIYKYGTSITVIDEQTNEILMSCPLDHFKEMSLKLFEAIKNERGRSFAVPEVETFLRSIHVAKLKATSTDKSDITIKVHDHNTGFKPMLGFSIKSRLGGASTLLNAGKTTNFTYQIDRADADLGKNKIAEINAIDSRAKIRERIEAIYETGAVLQYVDMNSEMFKLNLQVIDTKLPEIIAGLILYYYRGLGTSLEQLLEHMNEHNPLVFDNAFDHPFYEYKIKNFLRDVALGMTPSKQWDGTFDATGGYIIVKEDGDVLCYHLYNMNEFQDYLLNNTRLETASTSRYDFGNVYEQRGNYYIDLNLQIRFV